MSLALCLIRDGSKHVVDRLAIAKLWGQTGLEPNQAAEPESPGAFQIARQLAVADLDCRITGMIAAFDRWGSNFTWSDTDAVQLSPVRAWPDCLRRYTAVTGHRKPVPRACQSDVEEPSFVGV